MLSSSPYYYETYLHRQSKSTSSSLPRHPLRLFLVEAVLPLLAVQVASTMLPRQATKRDLEQYFHHHHHPHRSTMVLERRQL
jgi:hypothetical protein